MSENASVALSLFGTIVTWALAWLVVVDHCNKQGGNLFVSHLLGIFIGSGAAFGAFCVTGALFLPSDNASTATGIGNVGAAILLVYWIVYLFATRSNADQKALPQKKVMPRSEQEKTPAPLLADDSVFLHQNLPIAPRKRDKKSRWLFPLAMGLWLGNIWGDDD